MHSKLFKLHTMSVRIQSIRLKNRKKVSGIAFVIIVLVVLICRNKSNSGLDKDTLKNRKKNLENIWNYVYEEQYFCVNKEYVGVGSRTEISRAYYVCKDLDVWPFLPGTVNQCLVYSFGIDSNFNFDDAMAEAGCEVHAFDPSIDLEDDTVRNSGVNFHKMGIAKKDDDYGFNGWKMRTLRTIITELGHEKRVLDYLKVDTDKEDGTGFEDVVMEEMLKTGLYKCVRQYTMQIHMPGPLFNENLMKRCENLYNHMLELNAGGFRLYKTVDNLRAVQSVDPNINQMIIKKSQFDGKTDVVLWETHFVNINLEGECYKFFEDS